MSSSKPHVPPVDPDTLYTIPIADRPRHGPLFSKVFFPLAFNLGILGINAVQFCALPLLLLPVVGRGMFEAVIDWTKDSFGRLLILITVLFAPTSLHLTTDSPSLASNLVERDAHGRMTRINLPDRLVIMANHQCYTDWMYMWILACYAGHAEGLTILLKWSLRHVPFVGWGMRFFRFIFLRRSWAADRTNLTKALTRLGKDALSSDESTRHALTSASGSTLGKGEDASLLPQVSDTGRSPLWLLIFPEGTITSDEERAKSVKYANKEGIDDLAVALHPRSTGLLFCLRTLLPQVPDLQLLDVTIGYPGVPLGKYPQYYYGLGSVFFNSVPPPTVHMHLRLHSDLSSIPSLNTPPTSKDDASALAVDSSSQDLATPQEARAFELWLRGVWQEKDERLKRFIQDQKFEGEVSVVRIRQTKWYHWAAAFGAGGVGGVIVAGQALTRIISRSSKSTERRVRLGI